MSDSFFDGPVTNEAAEEIQRLRDALETKTREAEAQQDRYLRTVAEFDNVRKRSAREREEYTRYANESLLRDILPVLDNLDRAMQAARSEPATSLTTGVELIQRELLRVLEKFGVTAVHVGGPALRSGAARGHRARARARTCPTCRWPRRPRGATSCTGACCGPRWSRWPWPRTHPGASPADA